MIRFVLGKNTKRKIDVALLLGDPILERKKSSKDVGLIVKESLNRKEHVEHRISEDLKSLFLLKRNTQQSLNITTKVQLYRAIINTILLFGSECWELKKVEHKLIKNSNAKALVWICGNKNYIDSVFSTNSIPPLYKRSSRIFCCTKSSSTATIQLTLHSALKSRHMKEDRQEYYYRQPSTKHNTKISGTELELESI